MRGFILDSLRSKWKSAPSQSPASTRFTNPSSDLSTGSLYAQQHSIFFKALSTELRLLIYEAALVDSVRLLHVVHSTPQRGPPKQIGHWRCEEPKSAYPIWQHKCFGTWVEGDTRYIRDARHTNGDLVSLLMTCRRIYMEAVEVLYTKNHFSFSAAKGLHVFRSIIAPCNWQALKYVHLSTIFLTPVSNWHRNLQPPENIDYWETSCQSLASLPKLRLLYIDIIVWDETKYDRVETLDSISFHRILSPLCQINAQEFQVELNVKLPEGIIGALGKVPFQLLHRQRDYDWEAYPV